MRLYYQNPGQSTEFEIDGAKYELQTSMENDIGDSLDFASELDHIRMGAKVRAVSDTGDMRFVGVVYSIEYSASGGKRRYNCIATESLLSARVAPPIVYPVGAALSNVISDDPPAQSLDYEILTGYTEVDTNAHISASEYRATATNIARNESAYIYHDFGAGYFDSLDLRFAIRLTSTSGRGSLIKMACLTNVVGDWSSFTSTDIGLELYRNSNTPTYQLKLQRAAATSEDFMSMSLNTTYYCWLYRPAGSDIVELRVFSDENYTTLIDTLSVSGLADVTWQYLYAITSNNTGGTQTASGYCEYIDQHIVIPFRMGLLWLARSGITEGLVAWSNDGIGTLTGWGPKTTGHDIYYNGHLCTEVGLSALDEGDYRCAFQGSNLYIRGTGTGDVYGVIAADCWNENFVRLGTIADDFDLATAYNAGEAWIWDLIRDLVTESGQYIVFRRETDGYVYLDVSASPKARGSEDAPFASLHIGDDCNVRSIKQARDVPYSCVVGLGAGAENTEGVRHGIGSPTPEGQAWIEGTYELADARLPPWGHLDQATQDYYDAIRQHSPVEIDLYRDDLEIGDWIEIDLGIEKFAAQIRSMSETNFETRATIGAPDLSIVRAFWERSETSSIEAYRDRIVGESSGQDDLKCVQNLFKLGRSWPSTIYADMPHFVASWGDICIGGDATYSDTYIWRSTDAGITWSQIYNCGSGNYFVAHPVVWSNGYGLIRSYNGRIYKTTDYGATWSLAATLSGTVRALGCFSNGYALAAADNDVYQSTDYGSSWTYKYSFSDDTSYTIFCYDDGVALLGTGYTNGRIYRSTDYGATWSLVYTSDSTVDYIYTLSGNSDGKMFAGTIMSGPINQPGGGQLLSSDDFGATWSIKHDFGDGYLYPVIILSTGDLLCVHQHFRIGELYLSPEWSKLYISYDFGDNFTEIMKLDRTESFNFYSPNNNLLLYTISSGGLRSAYEDYYNWLLSSNDYFEILFTPDNFEGEEGLILFSLSYSGSDSSVNPDARADYFVVVNDIVVAFLGGISWGGGNIITDLDISSACILDGSEESVKVYAVWTYDLEETCTYTGTVRGITKP